MLISRLEPLFGLTLPEATEAPSKNSVEKLMPCDMTMFVPQPNHETCFSDVVFVTEDSKFYAHKILLCSKSPYFLALLLNGMQETGADEISVHIDSRVLHIILIWIYTDKFDILPSPFVSLESSFILDVWSVST